MTCVLAKKAGKAFTHRKKIYCLVTTLYEIGFFSFCRESRWESKETYFALLGSRSEHRFPARSRVSP